MMDLKHPAALLVLPICAAITALAWSGRTDAAIHELSQETCAAMMQAGVLTPANPVACDRLRAVSFGYVDMQGGEKNDGRIIVLDVTAGNVQAIMDGLHRQRFPLAKARPIEAYRGDDDASMDDNDTSAFNGRAVTGGTRWSLHAYGVAIDLNPHQNPYISPAEDGSAMIKPAVAARSAVNRLDSRPDKPVRPGLAEDVVDLFAEQGFIHWGGYWNFPIDYQHFEIGSRAFVERLASLPPAEGAELWRSYTNAYRACRSDSTLPGPEARADCVSKVMQAYTPAQSSNS
jgi:D-alanyl-D-alanine carboxypeptidase